MIPTYTCLIKNFMGEYAIFFHSVSQNCVCVSISQEGSNEVLNIHALAVAPIQNSQLLLLTPNHEFSLWLGDQVYVKLQVPLPKAPSKFCSSPRKLRRKAGHFDLNQQELPLEFRNANDNQVSVVCSSGAVYRMRVTVQVKDRLVNIILDALRIILLPNDYLSLWASVLEQLQKSNDEWNILSRCIFDFLGIETVNAVSSAPLKQRLPKEFERNSPDIVRNELTFKAMDHVHTQKYLPNIFSALHLVFEEIKLNTRMGLELLLLGDFLVILAKLLQLDNYLHEYAHHGFTNTAMVYPARLLINKRLLSSPIPNIFNWVKLVFSSSSMSHFPSIHDLLSRRSSAVFTSNPIPDPCQRTRFLVDTFTCWKQCEGSKATFLQVLGDKHVNMTWVHSLPVSIALIIRELMYHPDSTIPKGLSSDIYHFIGIEIMSYFG
jgi:hypothetical protein